MLITLIILVLSAAFFVAGKVRSDIVALCALIGLLIFQILTPEEALSGFSNSVVIGAECRNESQPSIDAFGFCQQYGRYDDTYRYAS